MGQRNLGYFIAIGLTLLGLFIFLAAVRFKDADRQVSVRGLSEREVEADEVLWPVAYSQTGDDLQGIYNELERKNRIIIEFLTSAGISQSEIMVNSASIVDLEADRYSENRKDYRYIATQVITITSSKVKLVVDLQRQQNKLLKSNIALLNDAYQYATEYIFTKLNDIKPTMIQEATQAAREAAQKFADDSQSSLGSISTASQGQFSITDRDRYTPQIKKIRVVTYISYSLQ